MKIFLGITLNVLLLGLNANCFADEPGMDIYLRNLSGLNDTCHDGYILVIPCKNDQICVVPVHSLWVRYALKGSNYKTFYDYLKAVSTTPGLYDSKGSEFPYRKSPVYKEYLKIGFDAFLEKYTYIEYAPTGNGEYDDCVFFSKAAQLSWAKQPGWCLWAAVKIMADHGYYIQEPRLWDFTFFKTFHRCITSSPIPNS